MLRPGRLDKLVYVPLPAKADRASILRAAARQTPLAADVDLDCIGRSERCEGYSGADLASLVKEAAVLALKDSFAADDRKARASDALGAEANSTASSLNEDESSLDLKVFNRHFQAAFDKSKKRKSL